jgi:hypothetical protein
MFFGRRILTMLTILGNLNLRLLDTMDLIRHLTLLVVISVMEKIDLKLRILMKEMTRLHSGRRCLKILRILKTILM